jgi:RimJ/RimL family protein N-acetyltransferase
MSYKYYELGYLVFSQEDRGKGYASAAVSLLTGYLFNNRPINKLLLSIVPENGASRRVAEKCGYSLEGIDRQAVFIQGRFRDLERYSLVRAEWEQARPPAA